MNKTAMRMMKTTVIVITENSDQDNDEYNNSEQEFSDNDPPYDSEGEGSNEDV